MLLKAMQVLIILKFLNYFNPELQLKDTKSTIKRKLIELLTQSKGFKFVTTLVLVFKKTESKDKTNYGNFYSNSKVEIIINESDIDDVFQSIYTTIITNIQKYTYIQVQPGLLTQLLIILLVFQSIIF